MATLVSLTLMMVALLATSTLAVINHQQILPSHINQADELYFGSSIAVRTNGYQDPLMISAVNVANQSMRAYNYWWNGNIYYWADETFRIPVNISAMPSPDPMIVMCAQLDGYHLIGTYWHQTGGAVHITNWPLNNKPVIVTFNNPNPTQSQFGYKVGCAGNFEIIAIYDRQLSTAPANTSHVYIYKRPYPAISWPLHITYTFDSMSNGQPLSQGVAVSADGNVVAFGAAAGTIQVCRFEVCQTISIPGEVPYSMILDTFGDRLAYGDITYAASGHTGRVVVYEYVSANNSYSIRTNLVYPFKTAAAQQGYSISFNGVSSSKIYVGMPQGYGNVGAIAAWASYTPGSWIPIPTPFIMFGTNQGTPSLGTSVAANANRSMLYGGTPSTSGVSPKGSLMYYTFTNTWPPSVLPTLPNWQSFPAVTTIGLSPAPAAFGFAAFTSDGSAFVGIGRLGSTTLTAFYAIVYRKEETSGYYVMDATQLTDSYGGPSTTRYGVFPSCLSDDTLTMAIGSRRDALGGGFINIYTRTSVGTDYTLAQVINSTHPTADGEWPAKIVCTPTLSSMIIIGLYGNMTMDVFTKSGSTWSITYTEFLSEYTTAYTPIAMSRNGLYYAIGIEQASSDQNVIVYKADRNLAAQVIPMPTPSEPDYWVCALAMDYYGWRLAVGFCLFNSSQGLVHVYDYLPSTGLFNTTPVALPYSDFGSDGNYGANLAFSDGGDVLAVMTRRKTGTMASSGTVVWKAPLGYANWTIERVLLAFDSAGGITGATISADQRNSFPKFLSGDATTSFAVANSATLVYKNVSTSVLSIGKLMYPSEDYYYNPYQAMNGSSVPGEASGDVSLYGLGQALSNNEEYLAHAYYENSTDVVKFIVWQRDAITGIYAAYADPVIIPTEVTGNGKLLDGTVTTIPMCISNDGQTIAISTWWATEDTTSGKVNIVTRNSTTNVYSITHEIVDPEAHVSRTFGYTIRCQEDLSFVLVLTRAKDTSVANSLRSFGGGAWSLLWTQVMPASVAEEAPLALSGLGTIACWLRTETNQIRCVNAATGLAVGTISSWTTSFPVTFALDETGMVLACGFPAEPDGVYPSGRVSIFRALVTPGIFSAASRVDIGVGTGLSGFGSSLSFCGNHSNTLQLVVGASGYNTNVGALAIYRTVNSSNWYHDQDVSPFGATASIQNQYLGLVDTQNMVISQDCSLLVATAPCLTQQCPGYAYTWDLVPIPVIPPVSPPVTPPPVEPPVDPPVTPPPVAPPVAPPITPPPVEPPVSPPVTPPVEPPVAIPVAPPQPPVDPPVDPPIEPPVDAPVSPPVNPPENAPVDPPTEPPHLPPGTLPQRPPSFIPVVPPTTAVAPEEAPVAPIPPPSTPPTVTTKSLSETETTSVVIAAIGGGIVIFSIIAIIICLAKHGINRNAAGNSAGDLSATNSNLRRPKNATNTPKKKTKKHYTHLA
jgi:hypothetical protein